MPQRGKKYIDATRRFDRARVHSPAEALGLIKSVSNRNFDETVEAAFRLGVPATGDAASYATRGPGMVVARFMR